MELSIVRIADSGTDKERVILRVIEDCDLGRFLLFDTTYEEVGIISNKLRHLYLLPSVKANKGDFVWVYTGHGEYHTHENTSKTKTHNLYWGLDSKVWNNDGDKVYLLKYSEWLSRAINQQE